MLRRPFAVIVAFSVAISDIAAQTGSARHGVIRGVVRDTLGRPKPGVLLQLVADSATTERSRHRRLVAIDTADDEGRFEFSSLAPQRYVLIAESPGVEASRDTVITSANDTVSTTLTIRERYFSDTPAYIRAERLVSLGEAQAQWASRRTIRYRLTVKLECFCIGIPDGVQTLEFLGDSVAAVIDKHGRRHPTVGPWLAEFSPAALFAHADTAIRSFERVVLKIEYDPTYGVPTLIDTDTAYGHTDAWLRLRITDFRPIP